MRICSGKGNAMKDKQKEKEKELFGLFGEMDMAAMAKEENQEEKTKEKLLMAAG